MKTQILICITIFGVLSSSQLKAQERDTTLKSKYERETILLNVNNERYVKNNETKKVRLLKDEFDKEFINTSPETKEELETSRRFRKRGLILTVAGGAVFITAAAIVPVIALPVFFATFGSGVVAYNIGAFNLSKSQQHLQKAIWLRNRDVLVKN